MNKKTTRLSHQEIETLCALWLECRLTRAEELDLMKVLADSDASSPMVEETRGLMGLETVRRGKKISFPSRRGKRSAGFRRITMAVAAVFAALLCTTVYISLHNDRSDVECVVYANGEQVKDASLSQQMARADYLESMKFMEEMEEFRRNQLREANLADESF